LKSLHETPSKGPTKRQRTDRQVLEDVLEGVRTLQRSAVAFAGQPQTALYSSDDWQDYYIRGVNLMNARGGFETDSAALRHYAQAIAIAPRGLPMNTMSRLYAYHAAALKRLHRLEEAKNGLVLAQQLASEDREIADAMYNMACVLAMNREADKAIAQLRDLIKRDPRWARIVATKSYFKNISGHPDFIELIRNVD
jgi:tetratricopeptide (TPR) repeat protein